MMGLIMLPLVLPEIIVAVSLLVVLLGHRRERCRSSR